MKPRAVPLALLLLACVAGDAAGAPAHFVDLHLLHPWATSPDPETRSKVRLSAFWGRSGSVGALDLAAVAAGTSGDVRGLQFAVFHADVGRDLRGIGAAVGVHRVGRDLHGVQYAVGAGWTRGRAGGFQLSGLLNYAGRGLRGAQFSGLMNLNDGPGRWAQVAGGVNVTVGDFTGWQISSFVNHVNAELRGVQSGVLNNTDTGRGLRLGVVNLAREFQGLQIGAVNAAEDLRGLPLGLVNLERGSGRDWLVYASTAMIANLGFRTTVNGWVSTVVAGFNERDALRENAGSVGWHFGRRLRGDARRNVAVDFGIHHVMPHVPEDGSAQGIVNHPLVQLRLTFDWALSGRVLLHGAVGTSSAAASYEDDAESEGEGLAALGVVLR